MKRSNGHIIWEFPDVKSNQSVKPVGVTCDDANRIYVADSLNNHLVVIDSLDGQVLQNVKLEGVDSIEDVHWTNNLLTLLHGHERLQRKITLYGATIFNDLSTT